MPIGSTYFNSMGNFFSRVIPPNTSYQMHISFTLSGGNTQGGSFMNSNRTYMGPQGEFSRN